MTNAKYSGYMHKRRLWAWIPASGTFSSSSCTKAKHTAQQRQRKEKENKKIRVQTLFNKRERHEERGDRGGQSDNPFREGT